MSRTTAPKKEKVYSQLYSKIVSGQLCAGARLVERDLADEFDVSRTVIREVIQQMVRDGIVRWNRADERARPVVAPLYEREMEELNEIVASLEALAVRRIASWPEKKRMPIVRELRKHNARLAVLCKEEPFDMDAIVRCDHDFHTTYSYAGAGPRVAALRRTVKPQAERYYRAFAPAFISHTPEAIKEHEEIIKAIEEGNSEKADRAVYKTWRNGSKRLAEVMASWNSEGESHHGHA